MAGCLFGYLADSISTRRANSFIDVFVASIALFIISNVGHRGRPVALIRFDGLNVDSCSPAFFAIPDADKPLFAARRSMARHRSSCVIIFSLPPTLLMLGGAEPQ